MVITVYICLTFAPTLHVILSHLISKTHENFTSYMVASHSLTFMYIDTPENVFLHQEAADSSPEEGEFSGDSCFQCSTCYVPRDTAGAPGAR